MTMETNTVFTAEERLESLKAAGLAGLATAGTFTVLLLTHPSSVLGWIPALPAGFHPWGEFEFWRALALTPGLWPLAIATLSGSLFGLTYRYAVRRDANPQLKAGVVLAFGLVRGLAQVDTEATLVQPVGSWLGVLAKSLLLFMMAGACLEVALQNRWIKPFGPDAP